MHKTKPRVNFIYPRLSNCTTPIVIQHLVDTQGQQHLYIPNYPELLIFGCICLHNDVDIKIGIIYKNAINGKKWLEFGPLLEYSMEAKQIYIFLHILPAAVLRTNSYRRNKGFFSFLTDAFFLLMRGCFSVSIVWILLMFSAALRFILCSYLQSWFYLP